MTTLKPFWVNMIPFGTESVRFFMLMNSATKPPKVSTVGQNADAAQ